MTKRTRASEIAESPMKPPLSTNLLQVPHAPNRQNIASLNLQKSSEIVYITRIYRLGEKLQSVELSQIFLRRIVRGEIKDKEANESEERNQVNELRRD